MTEKIEKTIRNLRKNNMEVFYAEKKENVKDIVKSLINDSDTVAVGGSVTLEECEIIDYLRCGKFKFLDRYEKGLSSEEINEIFIKSFGADVYLSGTNAVTEDGYLYNADGNSNRVAAICFGPKSVIIIAGINKIVKDVREAEKRVKMIAAPKNCERLSMNTYCAKTGSCAGKDMFGGCKSPDRICCNYVLSGYQRKKNRIKIILVGENLGY